MAGLFLQKVTRVHADLGRHKITDAPGDSTSPVEQ